jgi:hypothetical protein
MKTLLTIIAILALATAVQAQTTACYSWEDGGTSLGDYGLVSYSVDGTHASDGFFGLSVAEVGSGTGQIYVAYICGLNEGDVVTASFDVYDESAGSVYTSTRIWGHYALPGDVNSYAGSAGGNSTYSDGLGWNNLSYTWTIPALKTCLVVEVRPYGASPFDQAPNWVDNLCVTAPDNASIQFPGGLVAATESTWGGVKSLFR